MFILILLDLLEITKHGNILKSKRKITRKATQLDEGTVLKTVEVLNPFWGSSPQLSANIKQKGVINEMYRKSKCWNNKKSLRF